MEFSIFVKIANWQCQIRVWLPVQLKSTNYLNKLVGDSRPIADIAIYWRNLYSFAFPDWWWWGWWPWSITAWYACSEYLPILFGAKFFGRVGNKTRRYCKVYRNIILLLILFNHRLNCRPKACCTSILRYKNAIAAHGSNQCDAIAKMRIKTQNIYKIKIKLSIPVNYSFA